MSKSNRRTGNRGEQLAADYLSDRGYAIIARNFSGRRGEIDIIAQKGSTLVFCEVKTRRSAGFGSPASSVTGPKQASIIRTAMEYMATHDLHDTEIRFDVIAILLSTSGKTEIEHITAAFEHY